MSRWPLNWSLKIVKEQHFNNKANAKQGTDGQKLKNVETDCDIGLLHSNTDGERAFVMVIAFDNHFENCKCHLRHLFRVRRVCTWLK